MIVTTRYCKNGRRLVFGERSAVVAMARADMIKPCVTLMSAWSLQSVHSAHSDARPLIAGGCVFFVCVGSFAEQLHDAIDDVIVELASMAQGHLLHHVSTSWHVDEPWSEVIDFFVREIDVSDRCQGDVVAALDDPVGKDSEIAAQFASC